MPDREQLDELKIYLRIGRKSPQDWIDLTGCAPTHFQSFVGHPWIIAHHHSELVESFVRLVLNQKEIGGVPSDLRRSGIDGDCFLDCIRLFAIVAQTALGLREVKPVRG